MLLTESNMGDEVATVGMAAAILSLSTVGARNCSQRDVLKNIEPIIF